MLTRSVRRPRRTLQRAISGFAEQTRQERCAKPEVSPAEAKRIFSEREQLIDFRSMKTLAKHNFISKHVHSNLLPSNSPTEDRRATCLSHSGSSYSLMCGVFDGHAGPNCAQLLSERLFYYLHFATLPNSEIEKMLERYYNKRPLPSNPNFFRTQKEPSLSIKYHQSQLFLENLMSFGERLISEEANRVTEESIYHAATQLDADLLKEALMEGSCPNTVRAAISGAVACWTFISQNHLYVANTGDAAAVLVQRDANGRWRAKRMSSDHTAHNQREVTRIFSEHPPREKSTLLRNNRLLNSLSPLRAFGDGRFKLPIADLADLEDRMLDLNNDGVADRLVLPHYRTPPYLTARPQIRYHRLGPADRALIIASDGLWDVLSAESAHSENVAELIGMYLERDPEVYEQNAATMLIRRAIGEGWDGYDELEVLRSLAQPEEISRQYRDDITVQVIFF